jgi:hypothetical protein
MSTYLRVQIRAKGQTGGIRLWRLNHLITADHLQVNAITARVLVAVGIFCMTWLILHSDAPNHAALSPQSQESRPTKEYSDRIIKRDLSKVS